MIEPFLNKVLWHITICSAVSVNTFSFLLLVLFILDSISQTTILIPKSFRKANPAMGQGHSYMKKFTVRDENDRIAYAVSSMQGLCPYMEDAVSNVTLLCTILGMFFTNGSQVIVVKFQA
jgi:hypothetical protein